MTLDELPVTIQSAFKPNQKVKILTLPHTEQQMVSIVLKACVEAGAMGVAVEIKPK